VATISYSSKSKLRDLSPEPATCENDLVDHMPEVVIVHEAGLYVEAQFAGVVFDLPHSPASRARKKRYND